MFLGFGSSKFVNSFLVISAVFSPIKTLYLVIIYFMIAWSILFPAPFKEFDVTIPLSEITATSTVPPPISTTILPLALDISTPAPIKAAIGSLIRYTFLEPALKAASTTALFSTSVISDGTHMIILGLTNCLPLTFKINSLIMHCVISSSDIIPSDNGLIATMYSGVLPIILYASLPTAKTLFFFLLKATTDGSVNTTPFLPIVITILAVPKSIPISILAISICFSCLF